MVQSIAIKFSVVMHTNPINFTMPAFHYTYYFT